MQLNCDCGNRTTLNGAQAATLAQLRQPFTCPTCGKVRPLPPWAGTGSPSRVMTILGLLVMGFVIAVASGVAGFVARGSLASQGGQLPIPAVLAPVAAMVGGTPEQEAVREYLRQHDFSGKWEELRWWKPGKNENGDTVIRMRFRSAHGFGALVVWDHEFVLKNGKVNHWDDVSRRPD